MLSVCQPKGSQHFTIWLQWENTVQKFAVCARDLRIPEQFVKKITTDTWKDVQNLCGYGYIAN